MYYAQKNYSQTQGISGRYSIASIGCLVTSFCNLEADYGNNIAPDAMDNFFRDNDVYIDVDDGVRDDLGWSSISRYDSSVTVGHTVDHGTDQTAGWPSTNQSIVRFYYRSLQSGQMIFHFCKVADAASSLIVDSWDGVTKKSPYGEPTAWAEYNHGAATAPISGYPYTKTTITPKQIVFNKDSHLYNLSLPTIEAIVAPDKWVGNVVANPNAPIWVDGIIHHNSGHDYYTHEEPFGYAVEDCSDYVAPPPAPPQGAMTVPTSTEPYTVVKTILGYATSNDAANDKNAKTTVDAGTYYVFNRRYSPTKADQLIALNVTTVPGKAGAWINPDKNVEDAPAPPDNTASTDWESPRSAPIEPEVTPVPVVVRPPNPDAWKKMTPLNEAREPELFISMNKTEIKLRDLENRLSPIPLEPLSGLHIVGTFVKDGVQYGRTVDIANLGLWFALPMTILDNNEYKDIRVTDYFTLWKNKLKKLIHDVRF